MTTAVASLYNLLITTGLPVDGVAVLQAQHPVEPGWIVAERPDGTRIRIDMRSPTAQQIQQAKAVVSGVPVRSRRQRQLAAVMQDVQNLSAADRQKLTLAVLAWVVLQAPNLARTVGVDIDGEEPGA